MSANAHSGEQAKVEDLKRQIKQKDTCWLELKLGDIYEKAGKVDAAIGCYKKAAKLATSGAHYVDLIWSWEHILRRRPLDPQIHLALASAFLNSQNSELVLSDAEAHCKRAIFLSPGQRNFEAEKLLKSVGQRKKETTPLPTVPAMEDFKSKLASSWSPPKLSGYTLVRVQAAVDKGLKLKELRILCGSGNKSFDASALDAVRSAPFIKLKRLQVPGLFDFLFVTDGASKKVDYISYGSVVVP